MRDIKIESKGIKMPRVSKYRSKAKKSVHRKKRVYKKRYVNVNRALQPVAQRYIAMHKYVSNVSTDVNGNYVFNLNSMFDPDRTGGGHQPYLRDQMAALYNRYRVISASWRIFAQNSTNPIQVASIVTNDVTVYTSIGQLLEAPRSKFIIQMPGGNTQLLKGHVSLPSVVGRTKTQYMADDRYQAQVDADPNEIIALSIFAADASGAYLAAQKLFVEITYKCEWFDLKTVAQS